MTKQARRTSRTRSIESLEDRRVMSADPMAELLGGSIQSHGWQVAADEPPAIVHHSHADADFWLDTSTEREFERLLGDVEQTLFSAHGATGLTQVRADYGFIGTGQTVAVIDSGIAWDHYALGGGFGSTYRVVGGWDFSEENDSNPYDDGPSGSHGTHVAGIVGADGSGTAHDGVAPGVDLVGLRVFNDAGAGYFSWVENALQWVHQNRNAFENPITAVNLSLGTTWNSSSLPSWAMLEDEFAQLESDGIFIAVSAGNAFASYNEPGLSYPAASPHVVPVMSVDDDGSLSPFSQRHASAIAAPGRGIVSTIPDYVGNQNGVADDFASFSGTSMAAPYVAGASALVREAMQFVGYTNITQDTIYDHMLATATSFFDTATSQYYKRLNLESAIDALMPSDEYGSTVATAHDLGTLGGSSTIAGLIGTLSDADYFRFTATATGAVTFSATTTHGLVPQWSASSGGEVSGTNGESFTLDVVTGQSYTIGISTRGGIGYYELAIDAQSAITFNDLGAITQLHIDDQSISGETWYRVTAGQTGYFTAEAFFSSAAGNVDLAWYDANMTPVATGIEASNSERVDKLVTAGEELYLRVSGANAEVDFRLTNMVSLAGSTVTVRGTAGDDVFSYTAGTNQKAVVNGVQYAFAAGAVTTINFAGDAGNDSIQLYGTAGSESVQLRVGSVTYTSGSNSVYGNSIENIYAYGGQGNDIARFWDSAGNDTLVTTPSYSGLSGTGFYLYAHGFESVVAEASAGGNDKVYFWDSAGDDTLVTTPTHASLVGNGFSNCTTGFDAVYAYAKAGGNDKAYWWDSAGSDTFLSTAESSYLMGTGFYNYASGFDAIYAYSKAGGNDKAYLWDSTGDDTLVSTPTTTYLTGNGLYNYVSGFSNVYGYAKGGGNDKAYFWDSAGDDTFVATPFSRYMLGAGFYNYASGFRSVYAYAKAGGDDHATFSAGDAADVFVTSPINGYMMGSSYYNYGSGFSRMVQQVSQSQSFGQASVDEFSRQSMTSGRPNRRVFEWEVAPRTQWLRSETPTGQSGDTVLMNVAAVDSFHGVELDDMPASERHANEAVDWHSLEEFLFEPNAADSDLATLDCLFSEFSDWQA